MVRHISEGDDWIVISVLINIPNLDRLVDRVSSYQLLSSLVPLYANTLALMRLNFHGAFHHICLSSKSLVVIIKDPELGITIVSA